MPLTQTPTQSATSVESASALSSVVTACLRPGELGYTWDTKAYWTLDPTAAAPAGIPTQSGQGRWLPFSIGPSGGGTPISQSYVPTSGQQNFVLALPPMNPPTGVSVFVNGIRYNGSAWSFSAPQTVQWNNTAFVLGPVDVVDISYLY